MKWYKINIPKPCREDWNKMTANKKGKFCTVCDKTVVDFTNKSTTEIQHILSKSQGKRICGHFNKKQLDTVHIKIPNVVFNKQYSTIRIFALALLLSMGTSLLSCKTDGKTKKIDSIEVIDSIPKTKINNHEKDSILTGKPVIPIEPPNTPKITGEIIHPVVAMGIMLIEPDKNAPLHFNSIDINPKFKNAKDSSKKTFQKQINQFVQDNFNTQVDLGLTEGKKRISVQFVIDKKGFVKDIKVRAPHKILEKETITMFKKLPQFIPGKQNGKNVDVKYSLPINFNVE